MDLEQDYRFDEFNDGSDKLVGELQLGKISKFVEQYESQLQDIETALEESLSSVWDYGIDPIGINVQPYEQTSLLQLVRTDNKVFNKIIIVFASLCVEIQQLKEQAVSQFYAPLKIFGEKSRQSAGESKEGDTQLEFGRLLNLLLDLSKFVNRCYAVSKNLIHQLASLYHQQQKLYQSSFKGVHLQTVFDNLSDLFSVLIVLDEIIVSNEHFNNSLTMYKRMVKAIKSDVGRYSVEEEKLWQLDKLLYTLKGQILDGRMFQNCISIEFDYPGFIEATQNKEFRKEFFLDIKTLFTILAAKIGDVKQESYHRYKWIGFSALFVFYVSLFKEFGSEEKKLFKMIWEMHKKIPVIHCYADVTWSPCQFYRKHIPMMIKLIGNPDEKSFQKDYLIKQVVPNLANTIRSIYLHVSIWMVRMESNLSNRANIHSILKTRRDLLIEGLCLAYQVGNLFKETVSLHISLGVPIKTTHIPHLCQCVELLKAIAATFHRRSAMIAESLSFIIQQISFSLQKCFVPIKTRLESGKKYSDVILDVLAAVNLALDMLSGTATKQRRVLLKLSMHVIFQMDFLKDEEIEEIKRELGYLDNICDVQDLLVAACDTSFIYWSRNLLPNYFTFIYQHPQQAYRLQYIFAALRDLIGVFTKTIDADSKDLVESFKKEIMQSVDQSIIQPLCRDIETDLRLHIHSHLQIAERNPWKTGIKDWVRFFQLNPLTLFDTTINIKAHVSHYLDTTFYNLTTVSLNNWKTYGEMRNLACEKYGLDLTEVHLPGQTLEQGIDILQIMRYIHLFVQRYNYNLNNQVFIEKISDSKTLNTINIGHISNSIRTHGIGIMNTTVNFIYQFLKQKFVIFSQFLYDDHIKSRLYRDIRYFKENKDSLNNKYPMERAQQFNKEIRKLGLSAKKESYLDQFRGLITEIGNAMGYIRMIRSGGFQYVSNAIKFVPDLQDIISFEDLVAKEHLSLETQQAAKNLDQSIDSLAKNFAEGTEYFKMLVSVFAEEFRNPQNLHLKNFFVIVPPLTINFVEHILIGKDKLSKRKGDMGFFSDDGFAIGVAYILKLLDQYKQFDSLHWFEEVFGRYSDEIKKVEAQVSKQKKEEQQTAILTLSKLQSYLTEFQLLQFSFDGARIFFKD